MEDKHATGISFSMLKDHMALQNAEGPYSYATALVQKDVHRCRLSQQHQDVLHRSMETRNPDICVVTQISCRAAEH